MVFSGFLKESSGRSGWYSASRAASGAYRWGEVRTAWLYHSHVWLPALPWPTSSLFLEQGFLLFTFKEDYHYFHSQGPALAAKLGFDPYWALPWAWCPAVCRDTEQCILLASWPCPFTRLHVLHSYIWTPLLAEWERATEGRRWRLCLGSMSDVHRMSSRRFEGVL